MCSPRPPADLDFLGLDLDVRRREEWTSTLPDLTRLVPTDGFDRLTVHHTGGTAVLDADLEDVRRSLRAILSGHMAHHYGDIGYHFLVDGAGRVWEGRSLWFEGAHVARENRRNVGIALLGNFEEQKPTNEQLATLETLVGLLADHFGMDRERIYAHRDLAYSLCPGRHVYPYVQRMKGAHTA